MGSFEKTRLFVVSGSPPPTVFIFVFSSPLTCFLTVAHEGGHQHTVTWSLQIRVYVVLDGEAS